MSELNLEATDNYLPSSAGQRLAAQLGQLKHQWPHFYDCIDPVRISESTCGFITDLAARAFDFDSSMLGGRGEHYRLAQQNPLVRSVGIRQLFSIVSPRRDLRRLGPRHRILDVLGGDGVLARAMEQMVPKSSLPAIVTSDLSGEMVAAARAYGLFAIQQPAQNLLLRDDSIDGVIIAYGTHHIPTNQRLQACREAFRVLKPGGGIALHDFEEGSPMCRWFNEVVDPYSQTGHLFPHITKDEVEGYLLDAGFEDVRVEYLYDPFILSATTPERAIRQLSKYLLHMYGLVKLVERHGPDGALDVIGDLADEYLRYDYRAMGLAESFGASRVKLSRGEDGWTIEAPRVALVAHGVKSHAAARAKLPRTA